jgi:hypothetical protein
VTTTAHRSWQDPDAEDQYLIEHDLHPTNVRPCDDGTGDIIFIVGHESRLPSMEYVMTGVNRAPIPT